MMNHEKVDRLVGWHLGGALNVSKSDCLDDQLSSVLTIKLTEKIAGMSFYSLHRNR